MSPSDPRAEDVPTTPLAPEDLRRAYADIAYGFHCRLPALELAVKQAIAVAAESRAAAQQSAELAGKCLGRLEEILRAQVANDPLPPPPRLPRPSAPELEEDEITLHGRPIPVQGGQVRLTTSDFQTLKTAVRVARESWSIAQKIIVAVGSAIVLGLGTIAGAAIHASYGVTRTAVVSTPPVVVAIAPDSGIAPPASSMVK